MVTSNPQFESSDNSGSTGSYSGTATTTPVNHPTTAGNKISGFEIWNDGSVDIDLSWDGGTTTVSVPKKSYWSRDIKGEPDQIRLSTASGSAAYKLTIDFEEY